MSDEIDKKMEMTNAVLEKHREDLKKMFADNKTNIPEENTKILLPMIRNVMPSIIASSIVNVQPMTWPGEKFAIGKEEEINGEVWYNVTCDDEIWQWVIDTIDDSQYQDGTNEFQNRLTLSPEAMMMFKLKWS